MKKRPTMLTATFVRTVNVPTPTFPRERPLRDLPCCGQSITLAAG